MVDPSRTEPGLSDHETVALARHVCRLGDDDVVEVDLGVAVGGVGVAEDLEGAFHSDAGVGERDQNHRVLLVSGLVIRVAVPAHEDEHLQFGVAPVARPPLLAVEDQPVLRLSDGRAHVGGVAAGDSRLGHSEAAPDALLHEGLEVGRLLLLCAEHVEDFHVARVGGLAVEALARDERPPHLLRDRSVLEVGAPRYGRQEEVPKSGLFRLFLDAVEQGVLLPLVVPSVVPLAQHLGLYGHDLLVDEGLDPLLELLAL
mmetsp:Transcript_4127/g.7717  ORF Transcript_4127/g.7717 Transcript_4127/m.7717 type:complete len:257 (-) Transcript_4127:476-1246(-)